MSRTADAGGAPLDRIDDGGVLGHELRGIPVLDGSKTHPDETVTLLNQIASGGGHAPAA